MAEQPINGSDLLNKIQANFDELYQASLTVLATNAQALALANTTVALTPANLAAVLSRVNVISFSGHNLAGACVAAGVKVGDVVLSVTGLASGTVGNKSTSFENMITVADQIQQSTASDLSANVYMAIILRMS